MAGFIRRYGFSPGVETITLIEGVIIVDLPPPGAINGVSSGTVGIVGEFPDMTYATAVDTAGVVTTKAQPVEVTSGQDMIDKVGGWDPTLGDFGNSGGSGFEALRNKTFARLIITPVNLASGGAGRAWRDLPTNLSATSAVPSVPMAGARVEAGREFANGTYRVRLAKRINFTSFGHFANAIDGRVTAVAAAVTQLFNTGVPIAIGGLSRTGTTVTATVAAHNYVVGQTVYISPGEANFPAGAKVVTVQTPTTVVYEEAGAAVVSTAAQNVSAVNFLTANAGLPVTKGTIVVLGQVGGAGALGANAGTFRVQVAPTLIHQLTLERMDGASFAWTTGSSLPFRLHPDSDADSGGSVSNTALADAAGYTLPCRPAPLAGETGTVPAATNLPPVTVPPVVTAGSWDVLSGLTLRSHQTAGFVYTATVQARNAVNDAALDALYITAIDGQLQDISPSRDINIVYAARTSKLIRTGLKTHILNASAVGLGRMACVAPNLQTVSASVATGDTDPGVGGATSGRHERVIYSWPGAQTFVPEAVGTRLNTADTLNTEDGILDVRGDGWMASVLSNLPPERNPGQGGPPVDAVLAPVLGLQRGLSNLTMGDYINMRATGIAGLRIDRTVGPIFQSGITTSLVSGQKNIARRRMADFIQDSVARSIVTFTKQPLTTKLKDDIVGQIDDFLNILKSPSNPPAQRIVDYQIDDKSGNTPDLEAKGIFVVIGRVRTLASADFIVFQTEIGEGVVISTN